MMAEVQVDYNVVSQTILDRFKQYGFIKDGVDLHRLIRQRIIKEFQNEVGISDIRDQYLIPFRTLSRVFKKAGISLVCPVDDDPYVNNLKYDFRNFKSIQKLYADMYRTGEVTLKGLSEELGLTPITIKKYFDMVGEQNEVKGKVCEV